MVYRHRLAEDAGRRAGMLRLAFVFRPLPFVFFDSKKKASKKPDPGSG